MGLFDKKSDEQKYKEMSQNSIKSRADAVAQKNGYNNAREVIDKHTENQNKKK